MKLRTRKAWLTLSDADGRVWRACWSPKDACLVLSTSNGRRIPRTAYRVTAMQILKLAQTQGYVVGPAVQLQAPLIQ